MVCDYTPAPTCIDLDLEYADAPGMRRHSARLPVVGLEPGYADDVGPTPNVALPRWSEMLGVEVWAKIESQHPTGSFKDRGLSIAIALGVALGARRFMLPTQGNAGVAAAAFSARAGCAPCLVYMPTGHRGSYYHRAAERFGARMEFAGDNIAEAGAAMRERHGDELVRGAAIDVSTFFEPGRLEGKKTMGLEIISDFAQYGGVDDIIYPTGGGTGLVGIARAYAERRDAQGQPLTTPRLVAIQSEGCAPVVEAFERGDEVVRPVQSKGTCADGLDVPGAIMGRGILAALRESGGHARRVGEQEMLQARQEISCAGFDVGYEAAATLVGLRDALAEGKIASGRRVLLLWTGGGMPTIWPRD